MILSDAGKMVEKWYLKIENKFPGVKCHDFVIMPNHYHFLIEILPYHSCLIVGVDPRVRPNLSKIIQWFKTMTSNEYICMVNEKGWRRFNNRLWQKSFDDRIMRGYEIDRYKIYIENNPKNWKEKWR
ncbi:MAG: transposase [Candidatus Neomarinimicrobiota bacterium]|jgi:REP element-mobilizing transposase RayT